MAKIRIDKIEAARRQIDTAIELHFEGRDVVSTHTLVSAGGRILRDLCEQKNTATMWDDFKKIIRPDK
jgi:hypothetical protein